MTHPIFMYGTLRHMPLLEIVLGHVPETVPARVHGYRVMAAENEAFPAIRASDRGEADGLLVDKLSDEDRARLSYYEADDFELREVTATTNAGERTAIMFVPTEKLRDAGRPWDLDAWVADHGAATEYAAREYMAIRGVVPDDIAFAAYDQMLVRGHSSVRAAREPNPATVRRDIGSDTIDEKDRRHPYARYFAVAEAAITHPVDDGRSAVLERAGFLMGDAVTLVPYDPARDRVLVIDQFRFGPYLRGDPLPWVLEPVAGRIDPGETPSQAARREAREEANVEIREVREIGRYYPSPGGVTEYLISFIGTTDLPDGIERVGGLDHEGEDILSHILPFERFMQLVESGEVATGPLLLSAYWLQQNRHTLA